MSIIVLGNLIAGGVVVVFSFIIVIAALAVAHDSNKDEYEYCHDCPYVLCTEDPKSDECWKWQEESKDTKVVLVSTPWFHSIDVQSEVEQIVQKKQ